MLAYLLTYLLTVCVWTPETKERTGDQEERREVGLETLKSVQFTGLDTLLGIERERERERESFTSSSSMI
jgi:hypothetical protein